MSLEYESRATVLGKFGDVCQGPSLDWRHKCKDQIIENTPIVFTDVKWKDLPYQAIVHDASSINFREEFGFEQSPPDTDCEQTNCSPSTANVTTTLCDFVLPNLETLSIGTCERHYFEWRDEFCEKFPEFRGFSPFSVVGNRVVFNQETNTEAMLTFAGEVSGELNKAWWDHIYRSFWVGDSDNVDQFDGLFKIWDEGISTQGTCDDYPLVPTCIQFNEFILGAAAVAAGETAAPGDVVLAVGDQNRPGDAPGTNVIDIYPGTLFATSLDITGMDTVDILTAWFELITNEWDVDVIQWLLGVGKNQTRCLAEVAACKQACRGGDCRHLLIGDDRDDARAEREANFIRSRSIELYPYTDSLIPMMQSPALRQRNKILFAPWRFMTEDGPANTLLWVWRDQQASDAGLFRDVPGLLDDRVRYRGNDTTPLHPGTEFREVGAAFESRAFAWLFGQKDNCFKWWNNAETVLLPQAPHLWLCLDGVNCDSVITLPCFNPGFQTDILSCAATTPNLVYDFTFDNAGGDATIAVGVSVVITSITGGTSLRGKITAVASTGPTADVEVALDALGPFADCVWDGTNLDSGGHILIQS